MPHKKVADNLLTDGLIPSPPPGFLGLSHFDGCKNCVINVGKTWTFQMLIPQYLVLLLHNFDPDYYRKYAFWSVKDAGGAHSLASGDLGSDRGQNEKNMRRKS